MWGIYINTYRQYTRLVLAYLKGICDGQTNETTFQGITANNGKQSSKKCDQIAYKL